MLDPHSGLSTRTIVEPPPVLASDVAKFWALSRSGPSVTFGVADENLSDLAFRRRRRSREKIEGAIAEVLDGKPGAMARLKKVDAAIGRAMEVSRSAFHGGRILSDLPYPRGALVEQYVEVPSVDAASDAQRLQERLSKLSTTLSRVPKVGRHGSTVGGFLATHQKDLVVDGLRRVALKHQEQPGRWKRRLNETHNMFLREVSGRVLDTSDQTRGAREIRAKILEDLLCFWAFRTVLEREFYYSVFVFGELDAGERLPSTRESRREWELRVQGITELAITLIGGLEPVLARFFRDVLSDPRAWSGLKLLYRSRIEQLIPGVLVNEGFDGWRQEDRWPYLDGVQYFRPFVAAFPINGEDAPPSPI